MLVWLVMLLVLMCLVGHILGIFWVLFWHPRGLVDAHCGAWGPNSGNVTKKVIFAAHFGSLVGANWSSVAGCWNVLGDVFVNVFPGMFWGASLAASGGG